jgi:hypothetical protein
MKNVFIHCTAKEFYEVLKPLLLTLEGYTCYSDEWTKTDNGCVIQRDGHWFPFGKRAICHEEINLDEFIAGLVHDTPDEVTP